ncbi:hypothetical protein CCP1ISM_90023 [Azospirillaceae bacterium]
MIRFWMIKNDMTARIDLLNKETEEFKFLSNNGWKVKREELVCTEAEMYQFLDKNGPSDIEVIKAAFPKYLESDLRNALGVLVYTAKTVDTMNGIKGGMTGVFVTARHQKSWAGKIQKCRADNKPVSMCDIPNPDVDPISTCDNKPKVADVVIIKHSEEPEEPEPVADIKASINLPKVVQKMLRKNIIEKSLAENLHNFDAFIDGLGAEYKCYWNEYLDDFKRKLILTEIKKKSTPA